jgi:hypothetical protein
MADTNLPHPAQGPRGRATAVSVTILALFVDALRQWLRGEALRPADVRGQIEDLLREEFHDIQREAAGEREPPDAT